MITATALWVLMILYTASGETLCRVARGGDLPPEVFEVTSCYFCHIYSYAKKLPVNDTAFENTTLEKLLANQEILDSFLTQRDRDDWENCCRQAQHCCNRMISNNATTAEGEKLCPHTWDGWLCWPDSKPGTLTQRCPSYSSSACSLGSATKVCSETGSWFFHPNFSVEWTDYAPCADTERHRTGVYLSIAAYSISFISLLPALFIFYKFSILHCFRVQLHKNLFLSLLLHALAQIVFHCAVLLQAMDTEDVFEENGALCRTLIVFITYFTVSNYIWMFCEGFYLHRQLIRVFKEETRLWMFCLIGWGVPAAPVVAFISFRMTVSNEKCWAMPTSFDWVWLSPCLLSLVVNSVFFIYILRVLVTLMRTHKTTRTIQFQKTVHAAIVLIPLFGLHFLLTIYRPNPACTQIEQTYLNLNRLLEGLQGTLIAVTFCYMNNEVRAAVSQKWHILVENQLSSAQSNYNGQTTCTTTQTTC